VLEQLYFSQELRSFDEVPIGEGEVKQEELDLAVQLIEQAASDVFDPEKYEDEVSRKVMALIEKKIEGEEITTAPEAEAEDKIVDLMEALKASLGNAADQGKSTGGRKPAKRAASGGKRADKKRAAN
jgi:DNA end-binding protein Ku